MKQHGSNKSNNAGFTLIELIVVVLIMGIAATALILNLGSIYGRNARNAAEKLANVLDNARIQAMSHKDGNVFVRIKRNASGDAVAVIMTNSNGTLTEGDSFELGNKGLTVSTVDASNNVVPLSDANPTIDLYFWKNTGAFKNGTKLSSIRFTGSKTAETVLVWETGRSYAVSID